MIALLVTLFAHAVPTQVQHTGRVFDSTGLPLSGSQSITFTLYDASAGGSSVWSETLTVDFDEGYFSQALGTLTPLDADLLDDNLFIAMDLGGTETPRQRLQSVPYAVLAGSVSGGVVDASEVRVDGTVVIDASGTFAGSLPAGSTLGGLTCSPGQIAVYNGPGWGCAPAGSNDWDDLVDVPAGLDDGDDVLDETAVDAFVANNGYVTDWSNLPNIPAALLDGTVDWTELSGIPADLLNGDDVLTDAQVDAYVENGALDLAVGTTVGGLSLVTDWSNLPNIPAALSDGLVDWTEVQNIPAGFADNVDDELSEAEVEAYVQNGNLDMSGYVKLGSGGTCDSGAEGALRYDTGVLELCDGIDWVAIYVRKSGSSPSTAGDSCQQIHTDHPTLSDGSYWIDPDGSGAYEVYCDMTTSGGGWTLVATLSDGGSDVWSQLNPTQSTGLWEDTNTLGTAPAFDSDYKSEAYLDVASTDLLIKQDGVTNVLQADDCWTSSTMRAFMAGLQWEGDGSDSNWSDSTGAHLCTYTDFGYNDPVLRASSSAKTLGFKWGERDGVQDTNKDRVMITTANANGSNHHVDSPTGLGGFTLLSGSQRPEDVNECQGDHPTACSLTAQSYSLFVR